MNVFTIGPWSSDGPDEFGDYNIVTSHEALAIGAVVQTGFRPETETAANARLAAAAPELLVLVQQWNALEAGSWNIDRHAREEKDLKDRTAALVLKIEGQLS